ncbi:D-tyrosyl-tRNA(Tyr) deacylase [Megasphaera sp. SW808]|jgi:D-tyrosyl-tRNA(Tyr) deacylase|uniref:D-aminoacyl-tRNA deacylase n=1 Tax=Megasphaera sp. SW808 TaxID=2530045 RepID=UPI00143BA386|nr:D-aminoacyl-tRNA deacylase [Megasphaera sp. SW808]NJE35270.1 D-tyrosyl-tRNA(Tyr) deacylase [Megasphaera sp. SW808]
MRAVVQRTLTSSVTSEGVETGRAGLGLTVLLGVAQDDDEKDALYMAEKIANLRIFEDDKGKMNRSLVDIGGDMLVVSQFTLCGDVRHGRRPSFTEAAPPELAEALYEKFVSAVSAMGIRTATGRFRTEMVVSLENHGPVTILVDSKKLF